MTSILYAEPELIIGLGRSIIFVNPNDLQIFKEITVPEDLTKSGLKSRKEAEDQGNSADEEVKKENGNKAKALEVPVIQKVALAPNRVLFAVATLGQKSVLLYQCRPEHAKLISVRSLARASSSLTFNSDSTALLVTDKSGDCYFYDCVNLEAEPRFILGHLSILYDIIWTPDSKHIVTCDRDDKIRVTKYPETYDIQGYCLGHTEFVSSVKLLENSIIVSISGDKTMRLWDYESCKELERYELPAPGIRLDVTKISEHNFQATVLFHQHETIFQYSIAKCSESNTWQIDEKTQVDVGGLKIGNICFAEGRLYLTCAENNRLTLKLAPLPETPSVPNNWFDMVNDYFKNETYQLDDVSTWFKKKYDNISDYLERKKRRIEEKKK